MIFSYFFTIILLFCATTNAVAQNNSETIEQIKNNPNYKWGEGSGMTYEEADEYALAALSRSIWTLIFQDVRDGGSSTITNEGITAQSKREIFTKSFTMATIPNAQLIEISPEPECRIFRYVHIDDINAMKQQKKQHIIDYVETGKNAEKRLKIDDALRCYHWGLMLAKANIDHEPIYIEFNDYKNDCLKSLPLKIKSVISDIKAELVSCTEQNGRYIAQLRFTYNGNNISTLQVWYNDGQAYRGPVMIRDGIGEFDLIKLPPSNKIPLRYEYRFKDEASNLDPELEAIYECVNPLVISANVEVPIKISSKNKTVTSAGVAFVNVPTEKNETLIEAEEVRNKKRMQLKTVTNNHYYNAVLDCEKAIKAGDPKLAKEHFDLNFEGYKMFETLLTKTGTVSLSGEQKYEFIEGNGLVLARFCRVKIKFSNGKSFMENIVFRFLPSSGKIESIAMALTAKAEDDIFNAALNWPEVSKFTIQRFMEDYQTAYALKRLDYIEKIFSDSALIITGSILTPTIGTYRFNNETPFHFDNNNSNVRYTKQSKAQYLSRLRKHFREREYIHLSFEDNHTGPINTQGVLKEGAAFGIQIKQIYSSPVYSDRGYLSLFLNMQGELPIIEVRFWQPENEKMITFDDFQQMFKVL